MLTIDLDQFGKKRKEKTVKIAQLASKRRRRKQANDAKWFNRRLTALACTRLLCKLNGHETTTRPPEIRPQNVSSSRAGAENKFDISRFESAVQHTYVIRKCFRSSQYSRSNLNASSHTAFNEWRAACGARLRMFQTSWFDLENNFNYCFRSLLIRIDQKRTFSKRKHIDQIGVGTEAIAIRNCQSHGRPTTQTPTGQWQTCIVVVIQLSINSKQVV